MNGPWQFLTVRKILPLLDLLAKFKRSKLLAARKAIFFYLCSCSQKNRSERHARECSQRPFVTPTSCTVNIMLKSPFLMQLNNVSVGVYVYTPAIEHLV